MPGEEALHRYARVDFTDPTDRWICGCRRGSGPAVIVDDSPVVGTARSNRNRLRQQRRNDATVRVLEPIKAVGQGES
ncbi:MAG TPA: hypothetical protein VII63_12240 [Caulobacteraceae bacterium]